jgi:hypothetical protein
VNRSKIIPMGNSIADPTMIPSGFPWVKSPKRKRVVPQEGHGMPVIDLKKQGKPIPVHK